MSTVHGKIRSFLVSSAALGAIAFASNAVAQTEQQSSNSGSSITSNVQEIVVTANKRDERLHDVAMGVTAVTGNDLQTRQELDFTEFAAQVPGFNVQSPGVGGENREILRGQNSGGAGATVATVIDEMPISFSGSDLDAGQTSTNPDTYDLKRVEVLKGPQGTLYGATAEGGVVKFVTNPPDPSAFHVGAEIGGDTVAHGGDGGSLKGYVNLPFWQDKAALRITGFDEDIPGYIKDSNLDEKDIGRVERFGGRASLLVNPTSDLSVRLTASHQEAHGNGFEQEQVVGTETGAPASSKFNLTNGYSFNTVLPQNYTNEVSYYISDIEYDLHFAKLTSITSDGVVRNSFNKDDTLVSLAPGFDYGQFFGNLLFGKPVGLAVDQLERLSKFNQEFRLSSEPSSTLFGHKFDWVGGVFLTREDANFTQVGNFTTTTNPAVSINTPPAGAEHYPSRFEEGAIFGQIDYYLTPTIDVAVGGRVGYDVEQLKSTTFCCVFFGSGGAQPLYKTHEQPDTWSVSPRWKIDETTTAYLRFSTGYRPGGPNLVPPSVPVGYQVFYRSDSTMDYEGGVRSDFFDHKVTVDLAAFYIDWSNIQILSIFQEPNGSTFGATGNAGSATSTGLEYTLGWNPLHGLSFSLIGAYTDAHLTQDAPGLGAFKGQALAYVPKWSNTIDADYQWRVAEGFEAFIGGTIQFVGTRYTDFASSTLQDPHAKLPSYNTVNLQAGLKHGPYTWEFYVKNGTNSKGIIDYNGASGFDNSGSATLITPRVVGVRIAAEY